MTTGRFLTARWNHLAMVNYEVDAAALRPYVPAGTELDQWQERTFASLVGFQFLDTRVLGLAIPFHRHFEEINLRFYVRRIEGDEVRRGVVFLRELVPRQAIALVARLLYNEPYRALPMRHQIRDSPRLSATYSWRLQGRWNSFAVEAARPLELPAPGSLDEFITEHYWGYTRQRDGATVEYQVTHPQWAAASGAPSVDADLAALYGTKLALQLRTPVSSFIAEGSAIAVHRPRHLPS